MKKKILFCLMLFLSYYCIAQKVSRNNLVLKKQYTIDKVNYEIKYFTYKFRSKFFNNMDSLIEIRTYIVSQIDIKPMSNRENLEKTIYRKRQFGNSKTKIYLNEGRQCTNEVYDLVVDTLKMDVYLIFTSGCSLRLKKIEINNPYIEELEEVNYGSDTLDLNLIKRSKEKAALFNSLSIYPTDKLLKELYKFDVNEFNNELIGREIYTTFEDKKNFFKVSYHLDTKEWEVVENYKKERK